MRPTRIQVLGPFPGTQSARAMIALAVDPGHAPEPVVVIWVPDEALRDVPLVERIRHEVEHAAGLEHPNIVHVFGLCSVDGRPARIVEFADGEPLRRMLGASPRLPLRVAARIVCDACTGVHYAHLAGNEDGTPLVHGDLRPELVLISFDGSTRVSGYGALAFAPAEAREGKVIGRRGYLAPEQILGGRAALTVGTDVYLLGLMLYECLTGLVPWIDRPETVEQAVLTEPLPAPPEGTMSTELRALIERACAKKASERYANPLELREAIERTVGLDFASEAEVAAYLARCFPEQEGLRAERRRLIASGIAEYAKEQSLAAAAAAAAAAAPRPSDAPAAPPLPGVIPSSPSAIVRRAQVVKARRAPPRAYTAPTEEPPEPPAERNAPLPWLIAAAAFVALAGAFVAAHIAQRPVRPLAEDGPAVQPRPAPLPAPELTPAPRPAAGQEAAPDAGGAAALASAAGGLGQGPGTKPTDGPAVDAQAALPPVDVFVDSQPPTSIWVDGKPGGSVPWRGRLPAGRYVLRFENQELGLSTSRFLVVRGDGPVEQTFEFKEGLITVNAPEGAQVLIDGVPKGIAPITGRISVYEGRHRIEVRMGRATWGQPFKIGPGQQLTFNVHVE